MELLILICLLVVIALLLQEKIVIKRNAGTGESEGQHKAELPDIMGRPKPEQGHPGPTADTGSQLNEPEKEADTFEPETGDDPDFDIEIPQEELDEVFSETPDFEEEEEELRRYGASSGESGLATGVTFDELTTAGALLQQDVLEPSQQKQAVDIVQKIQGTELFSSLENSIENASQKIARLLDRSLSSSGTDPGSSIMRNKNNDLKDFDINEFV